ncbi:MAG: hypothetical protein Q9165_006460 [Trypethelium subeluteriae]
MSPTTCCVCNASSTEICAQCRDAHYCSKTCQKKDWKTHKVLCKDFKILPERPSSAHRLGILLPMDEGSPKLVWIECRESTGFHDFDKKNFLGNCIPRRVVVSRNERRGFDLENGVIVHYNDNFLVDGSIPNQCYHKLVGGELAYDWRGPLLLMRSLGNDEEFYSDMTLSDFRHAIDFLSTYGKEEKLYPAGDNYRMDTCLGIQVTRVSEPSDTPLYRFEATRVPFDNLVFREPIAPISAFLKFPLQARVIFTKAISPVRPLIQSPVAFLYRDFDPESQTFGSLDGTLSFCEDNILVVRKDGEDLDPVRLAALCTFAKNELSPRFARSAFRSPMERLLILMSITEEDFEKFFDNYRKTANPNGLVPGAYGIIE